MEISHGKEGERRRRRKTSGTHARALSVEQLNLKGKFKREVEKGNLKGTNRRGFGKGIQKGKFQRGA